MKLLFNQSAPSFNEIVFESRNKLYGAYELRRNYEKHLFYAFMLTAGLFIASVLWIFVYHKNKSGIIDLADVPVVFEDFEWDVSVPPLKEEIPEGQLPADNSKSNINRNDFTPQPVENKIIPIEARDSLPTSNGNGDENPGDNLLSGNSGGGTAGETGSGNGSAGADENKVLDFAEINPEFPGGIDKMYAFLGKNLKYPRFLKENRIQGTVFVSFVVTRNGSIANIEILRSPHQDFDAEVHRVLELMPQWKPGKQGGNEVNVRYKMPIKFTLK
jgi:protein TonB